MSSPTDARGHSISLDGPPRRIVSLVPSQTELLAHLGLEAEVVGITRFCERPEHLRSDTTIVGGTKQVDAETVRTDDRNAIDDYILHTRCALATMQGWRDPA